MNKKIKKGDKKTFSIDWLIGGILTKIGDTFDRLTGRGYKPSSSLATSELIERLKALLDHEVKTEDGGGEFVPHNLKLKMQWDKFSADSDEAIQALENELKIAAIDHINDQRYHTFAPLNIEIKPDYFTEGVKLLASFEKFDEEEREAAVRVTVPDLEIKGLTPPDEPVYEEKEEKEIFVVSYTFNGKQKETELSFDLGERKSVGRTKENDLVLDDTSVSKIHAAFVFNSQSKLMLADTGSTNGTFINGKRIAYGRAFNVNDGDTLGFGTVEVLLRHLKNEYEEVQSVEQKEVREIPETENSNLSEIFGSSENNEDLMELEIEEKVSEKPHPVDEELSQVQPRKKISDETAADIDFEDVEEISENNEEPEPTKPGIVLDFGDK